MRNRAFVLGPEPFDGIGRPLNARAITVEKYFDSNEDLLLWDVTGRPVITEQMAAYPILDTSAGDFKSAAHDPYALFRTHADRRLRRGVDRSPWPSPGDGVDLHLIPSCGMQLHPAAVAARAGGWAFNCDGQYALGDDPGETVRTGTPGGVPSAFTDYHDPAGSGYAAHTQLARVSAAPQGADPRADAARDVQFAPAPDVDVTVLDVTVGERFPDCFAGGPGAVHIYGLHRPLEP